MIKVLHIGLSDSSWGQGADARLLHEGASFYGIKSALCVKYGNPGENSYRLFRADSLRDIVQNEVFKECDLVHLHRIQGYIRTVDVRLLKEKPVVWSLEDSTSYTAECLISAHCDKWQKNCEDCTLAKTETEKTNRSAYVRAKAEAFLQQNITFTCANEWQMKQLQQSALKDCKMEKVPFLCDEAQFYPGNKKEARINLGLPLASFVIVYHNELGGNTAKITAYLKEVLGRFCDDINQVFVVNAGKRITMQAAPGFVVRNVPQMSRNLLGEYYRAANLNVYLSPTDPVYRTVAEAALCALPTLVFDLGSAKEVIEADKTGYLIKEFDKDALYLHIGRSMINPGALIQLGAAAYKKYKETSGSSKAALAKYIHLYERVLGQKEENVVTDIVQDIYNYGKHIQGDVEQAFGDGWEKPEEFIRDKLQREFVGRSQFDRNAYVDLFCTACLPRADWKKDKQAIWKLIVLWRDARKLDDLAGFKTKEQQDIHLTWAKELRKSLVVYFTHVSLQDFGRAADVYLGKILHVWRVLFLNVQSPLHLVAEEFACPKELLKFENPTGYPFVFLKMMFVPYLDDHARVNIEGLMRSKVPSLMKMLMLFWMTSAPLYNGNELNRKNVLNNIAAVCDYLIKRNEPKEVVINKAFAGHFMVSLWRASYLGGNNREQLEHFGRFTQYVAGTLAPHYTKAIPLRKRKKNEPLRIGYISMNFRAQAVSQYMANRLKYADHKAFFVKTFILRRFNDEMTDQIRSYSDESVDFTNFDDIAGMAKAIRESNLDLLVYADIGMEIISYLLASLRLAPVQAVLVGHGTTSGLSTVDYYISGDHEPENAAEHYTEELVRLPQLGAAQLPPKKNDREMTRKEIGVPENAVLFISCANGLKHYPDRDDVLIDILRRLPEAYILLKPFVSPQSSDRKFNKRIMKKAVDAGVANRLKIAGPLPSPGDLMSLLTLADVQLDTYPYGGWTTNLEAIYYGLPIITQEGDLARNRWGAGMLRAMGIEEGIAHSAKEYAEWAVKIGSDAKLRQLITMRIEKNAKTVLFNGSKAQKSYEEMLLRIAKGKTKK